MKTVEHLRVSDVYRGVEDTEWRLVVGAAMDLVYGRHVTPFVRAAEAMDIRATDGAEMLVRQGAASFERWWGIPAPVEAMRAAMEKSLVD